jgi:ligand-binding SRPBCC domain-containing protein
MHIYKSTTLIRRPLNEVFEFFSKAENLNEITPPMLRFKILSPLPIEMKKGTLIDYSIVMHGIPFKWKTKITDWNPGVSFTDEQLKGPYRVWRHQHVFAAEGEFTRMTDIVYYLSPGWIFEPLIEKFFIKKKVKEIFSFRELKLKQLFPENSMA